MTLARLAPLVATTIAGAAIALPAVAQDGNDGDRGRKNVTASEKSSRGWSDCPFVDTDARPITGGCVAYAQLDARFRIVTPFGVVPFAECTLGFDAHIESNGSIALYGVAAGGASPCGDIRACRLDTDSERQPWLGEVVAAGPNRFVFRLEACMDTCAGWFEGPLELDLRRARRGWRLRADAAQLGYSGLEIDGAARFVTRRDLRLTTDQEP